MENLWTEKERAIEIKNYSKEAKEFGDDDNLMRNACIVVQEGREGSFVRGSFFNCHCPNKSVRNYKAAISICPMKKIDGEIMSVELGMDGRSSIVTILYVLYIVLNRVENLYESENCRTN